MQKRQIAILVTLAFAAVNPGGAQQQQAQQLVRQNTRGAHGAVAGGTDFATEAGMRIYYRGGNAVDAGVATMFSAAVTEFSHFGWGGEAPILIRTKAGKVYSIAGVGTMPKLATADMFRSRKIQPFEILEHDPGGLKGVIPVAGLMPVLVPGMVDAGLVALKDFGTKSFNDVIAPALDLADGYPIDETRANSIAASRQFLDIWPSSKAHFMPDGKAPRSGDIYRQPDLARTLRAMADVEKKALASGAKREAAIDAIRDYFYRGDIARKIDAFVKANGGLLRYEDMAAFKLEPEEPATTTFRGYHVYKPGFWSQGPAMLEALNIIEGFDGNYPQNSAEYIHRTVEALKLAYADRDTYYADPKFAQIPADVLLSKEYAAERRKEITERASLQFRPGAIHGKTGMHPALTEMATHYKIDDVLMAHDTTAVDAIDRDGMVFSATPSGAWMPSVIAGDTGIPLTQRGQSFILVKGHPNELSGGKRPRVTLSPTIVTRPDGSPYLALSTPGADNQEQSLIQIMLNVIEFNQSAQRAIEGPRFQTRHLVASLDNHAWNLGDLLLDERISPQVFQDLASRGHRMEWRSRFNNGAAPVLIKLLPGGGIEAGADPFYNRSAHAW
jgi:gamma-glutamyltranspeptidase/glutathione hydrolase